MKFNCKKRISEYKNSIRILEFAKNKISEGIKKAPYQQGSLYEDSSKREINKIIKHYNKKIGEAKKGDC